jgi:hypothetical protein
MPLLEIKQTKKLTIICSLEESTAIQVEQYAAFVTASPDDVVNKALEYTFGKDSEFQKYRSANPKGTGTLRIKKPAAGATGAPRGPKPGAASTKLSAAL